MAEDGLNHSLLLYREFMGHLDSDNLFEELCDDFESRLRKLSGALIGSSNYAGMLEQASNKAHSWLDAKVEEYGGEVDLFSNSAECIEDLISNVCFAAKIQGQFQSYLFLSLVCKRWGQIDHKIGKKNEGYKFITQAHYFYGLWKGALEFDEWNNCKEIKQAEGTDNAYKGGEARGRKFDTVKSEIVRLLETKAPVGGWKTKAEAVDKITTDLWEFIHRENKKIQDENTKLPSYDQKRQPINMKKDNLGRTVLDWSRNDENIKATFSLLLRKSKK